MQTHTSHLAGLRRVASRIVAGIAAAATLFGTMPGVAYAASSWNPTLLVNTEAFQVIDEGDSTTDIELRFGGTVNEKIFWNRTRSLFQISDDLSVQGILSGSVLRIDGAADIHGALSVTGAIRTDANFTINDDQTAADAVVTFGSDGTNETITFQNTNDRFEFSDDMRAAGYLSGAALRVDGLAEHHGALTASGNVRFDANLTINDDQTAADAVFTFGSDGTNETLTFANTLDRFEISDDLFVFGILSGATLRVSGNADIHGALSVTGAIRTDGNFTINDDGTAANAVLTFGNDGGNETFTFSDTFNEFELSDDLRVTGALSASGNVMLEAHLTGATVYIGGTLEGAGLADCDADGQTLSWDATNKRFGCGDDDTGTIGNGSGGILSLHPEYPNAIYFASGSTSVGQLTASGGTSALDNSYVWTSTRSALQDYWVSVRLRLPDNFSSWDVVKPIEFRYKTGVAAAANNHLTVRMKDTAGANVTLSGNGGLANTSWTTASITGPESGGTWTPKGYFTVYVKLAANSTAGANAAAGFLNFNFESTTP